MVRWKQASEIVCRTMDTLVGLLPRNGLRNPCIIEYEEWVVRIVNCVPLVEFRHGYIWICEEVEGGNESRTFLCLWSG